MLILVKCCSFESDNTLRALSDKLLERASELGSHEFVFCLEWFQNYESHVHNRKNHLLRFNLHWFPIMRMRWTVLERFLTQNEQDMILWIL